MKTVTDFNFLGFKVTVYSHCSLRMKRWLLLGRKAMTNLDSVFKVETSLCQQKCTYNQRYDFSSSDAQI